MVWARACEVGCAVSVCRPEDIYAGYKGDAKSDADPRGNGNDGNDFLYMLVCVYGAGFPDDLDILDRRPYLRGESCTRCPDRFSNCISSSQKPSPPRNRTFGAGDEINGKGEEYIYNLCCKSLNN